MAGKCVFCERPSYTGNTTDPEMCQKHLDIVLLAGKARRMGLVVTISNLQRAYRELVQEIRQRIAFKAIDIPGLVGEMRRSGHPLPDSWYRKGEEHHGHR